MLLTLPLGLIQVELESGLREDRTIKRKRHTEEQIIAILNPQMGILQSLIVGIFSPTLFARVYEFGHRHGLRCSIVGATWRQGDRCQFWGHNAVIRLAPFSQFCEMPYLPGKGPFSGHIISHDQIEASFMHRAGYAVRTLLTASPQLSRLAERRGVCLIPEEIDPPARNTGSQPKD